MAGRLPLSLVVLGLTLPSSSRAGNYNSFAMGNDAALMGPAVTAGTEEASAIWENPAGLAASSRDKLNVGLSVFDLQIQSVKDIVRFKVAGNWYGDDVDRVGFLTVPASVAYSLNLAEGLTLGFGIFVPELSSTYLRTGVPIHTQVTTGEDGEPFALDASGNPVPINVDAETSVEIGTDNARTVAGPALGWQALPWLRVGLSLFGEYINIRARWAVANDVSYRSGDGSWWLHTGETSKSDITVNSIACHAVVGVQLNPIPPLRIGLTFRTPSILVYQWVDHVGFKGTFSDDPTTSSFEILPVDQSADYPGAGEIVRPFRFHVGLAWKEPDWWVGTDFDFAMRLDNPNREVVLQPAWNLSIGARGVITQDVSIGGGFFTDRSPQPTPRDLGQAKLDFYGFTFGIETRTPLSLRKDPAPDALVFTSTFGVRYAVGVGVVGGLEVEEESRVVGIPVVFHELQLNLGSALYF